MSQYLLATHAFVCNVGRYSVILDLKRDTYLALDGADAKAAQEAVRGWPRLDSAAAADCCDRRSSIASLLDSKILTTDEISGKEATPLTLQAPERYLGFDPLAVPRLRHVLKFLTAHAITSAMLRWWPLERAVNRVHQRKLRAEHRFTPFDFDAAVALISIYFRLQPRAFSAFNACLRNSLTLVEFLARYGMYPTWVFGVRMDPFAAHSWVQAEDVVLNDTVEHVRAYTPIMAI